MDNNKNTAPEKEIQAETTETKDNKPAKKEKKAKKQKPLRNQAFLKRGSFSLAITATVIAAIIILNVLVGALTSRFVLEFDMSTDKTNSISQENIDFIKSVDKDIEIILCAEKEGYAGGYMAYYAQQYSVAEDAAEYYEQTLKLIEKYEDYNRKIKVTFMDTQSAEFADIAAEYSNITLNYGDILVSCKTNGTNRYKKVNFSDIYQLTADDTYASYGYTYYTVTGNKIETALTGAIAYVISTEDKKIALLTGHSSTDYTSEYKKLLEDNNYIVDVISDTVITKISSEYDAVALVAPSKDFISEEIIALTQFLSNEEKLDKGLLYFADATVPYLPNFSDFLLEWGITVEEGILFEPNEENHIPGENTRLFSYSSGQDNITSDLSFCVSGYNVPLSAAFSEKHDITVTSLVESGETVVAAPLGTAEGWTGFDQYTPKAYSTVIQSESFAYGEDNEEIRSYVMAFSSVEFIYSDYMEYSDVSNKDVTFAVTERAARAEDTGISFVTKNITNESFTINESAASAIRLIFMIILPITIIIVGIVIYFKRRNA